MQFCAEPGCRRIVPRGRCAAHAHAVAKAADARRQTATARGYQSREWRAFRAWWLARNPLCGARVTGPSAEHSRCVREGRLTYAAYQQVDHIVPVTGPDDPRFLDETAVQTLCRSCHAAKTAAQDGGFGR